MAEDPTLYVGTVKAILPEKGFGFAACDESFARYGVDVYLHSTQLGDLQQGMQIAFQVKVNAKGQPQAVDVSPADVEACLQYSDYQSQAAAPQQRYQSKVAPAPTWQPVSRAPVQRRAAAAQIVAPPTAEYAMGEAWVEAVVHGGARAGVPAVLDGIAEATGDFGGVFQAVTRWLAQNSGGSSPALAPRPRAKLTSLRSSPYTSAPTGFTARASSKANGNDSWGGQWHGQTDYGGGLSGAASGSETHFEGVVSAIKRATAEGRPGFGFIQCEASKAIYGDDVFLHSTQSDHLEVGNRVTFEVQMNKQGRPQAINIMCLD